MTDRSPRRIHPANDIIDIDTTVPNAARVYDYLLGGTNNFAIDREVAERNNAVLPGGIEAARAEVRANRAFLARAVRFLTGEAGIRQFLDIGTGIPDEENVVALAQHAAPDARIVCVDYDPVVLAHAHVLLRSTDEGAAAYIHGDLRDPETILSRASETLDLDRPVALVLAGILYLIPDDDDPYGIVRRLLEPLASGSYLAISHMTGDVNPEMVELVERLNETMAEPFTLRSHDEVTRFLDGLDVVEPGVVQVNQWRLDEGSPAPPGGSLVAYYVGVGRKP
ncbi:MAG TPA: SAM-dependent methyltransferase [Acidimicrobiales bacterium]